MNLDKYHKVNLCVEVGFYSRPSQQSSSHVYHLSHFFLSFLLSRWSLCADTGTDVAQPAPLSPPASDQMNSSETLLPNHAPVKRPSNTALCPDLDITLVVWILVEFPLLCLSYWLLSLCSCCDQSIDTFLVESSKSHLVYQNPSLKSETSLCKFYLWQLGSELAQSCGPITVSSLSGSLPACSLSTSLLLLLMMHWMPSLCLEYMKLSTPIHAKENQMSNKWTYSTKKLHQY